MKQYTKVSSNNKLNIMIIVYLIFNILFPKAGFKIAGIPITIGNIIFLLMIPNALFLFINRNSSINKSGLFLLFSIIYWGIRLLLFHGDIDNEVLISYIACLCGYPLIYFMFPIFVNSEQKLQAVCNIIKFFTIGIMIYSIIQYFWGIGETVIPGLTVNYSDYIENPQGWWTYKSNLYSDSSKMVSTYQNGNLFGVNLLLLFPIAYFAENNKKNRYLLLLLFGIACILSGTRTAYITIIVFILLKIIEFALTQVKKISIKTIFLVIVSIPIAIIAIGKLNNALVSRILTIFNWNILSSGTGRIPNAIKYLRWLIDNNKATPVIFGGLGYNYSGGAYEMTLFCIFILGGIVGLVFFILPIIPIYKCTFYHKNNIIIKGLNYSLTLYFIASISDGGYWLTPAALNLWMILSMANQYIKCDNISDNKIEKQH